MDAPAEGNDGEPCETDDLSLFWSLLPQPKPAQQQRPHGGGGVSGDAVDNNISSTPTEMTQPYRYLRNDQIESEIPLPITIGTLCWVSLSQGKNRTPRLYQPARVIAMPTGNENESTDEAAVTTSATTTSNDSLDPRFHVQYPKGSTYWVRKSNLLPVLEHHHHLILVASETTDYRRLATVHTTSNDHFIEIGCDFGILVDSVRAKSVVGIDKSETSIQIAKQQYPTQEFILGDIFEQNNDDNDDNNNVNNNLGVPHHDRSDPLVVAIDINGNRELPAVLKCIELVLAWRPRLIVVKSRALYAKMMTQEQEGLGQQQKQQ
ncbi:hypothetical protein IV203_026295 [Nitzschia inconspicua]|uniref:Methyltransferase domain-containing protein n=1 Tax=Nitzschia inconspicua TaxID=303405 RepID=A0A9K3PX91_9STRA|nr:hypothetical protein IV203_006868 [Nitzschia inconspicua]KAG7362935.1 hypothetical protein IV203_026295 [Nitzschia inconspicua]